MSSRLETWRPALRLIPLFRPYRRHMLALVLVSLVYAGADAGRAVLVTPLINKVLARGSEVKGQLEDQRSAGAAKPKEVQSARGTIAFPSRRGPAAVDAVRRQPLLGLAPAPPEGPPARNAELRAMLQRTRAVLLRVADDPDLTERLEAGRRVPDPEAWATLADAAALQARAEELETVAVAAQVGSLAGPGPSAQVVRALSLEARDAAYQVTVSGAWGTLKWIFLAAVVLAFVIAAAHWTTFYLARLLTAGVYVDLQRRTADHLLGLSVRFFEGGRRGDLLSRLTADLALTSNVITSQCDLITQVLRLAVLATCALLTCWQLALGLGLVAGGLVLPLRSWGRRLRRAARHRQGGAGDVFESVAQMLGGLRIVKAFQREEHELRRFEKRVEATTNAQVGAVRAREGAKAWMQLTNDILVPLLFLLGGALVLTRRFDLDAGRFGTFLGFVLLMYLPARAVGEAYTSLNDALPSLERVFQLLDERPDLVDVPGAVSPPPLAQGLRFDAVGFSYDGTSEVLQDVSFEAPAGTLTAVVGRTGSGKSTLVDLIARFHDPTRGRVLVDGLDLRSVKLAEWLDRIAVVPQQPFLFNASIRENIRYGRLDASDADIEAAAKLARVHDEVVQRGGYDDSAGERGSKLSGGQQQRVALARALVRNPDVLILDEVTSKLDATTERLVQEALGALPKKMTTFVVAHRLSTVRRAHQILVIDGGKLVERGTHDQLVALGGVYASLIATQLLGAAEAGQADEPPPKV